MFSIVRAESRYVELELLVLLALILPFSNAYHFGTARIHIDAYASQRVSSFQTSDFTSRRVTQAEDQETASKVSKEDEGKKTPIEQARDAFKKLEYHQDPELGVITWPQMCRANMNTQLSGRWQSRFKLRERWRKFRVKRKWKKLRKVKNNDAIMTTSTTTTSTSTSIDIHEDVLRDPELGNEAVIWSQLWWEAIDFEFAELKGKWRKLHKIKDNGIDSQKEMADRTDNFMSVLLSPMWQTQEAWYLSQAGLEDEDLEVVAGALKSLGSGGALEELDLSNNNKITDISPLAKALAQNNVLKKLDLALPGAPKYASGLEEIEKYASGLEEMAKALETNTALKWLRVNGCSVLKDVWTQTRGRIGFTLAEDDSGLYEGQVELGWDMERGAMRSLVPCA